MCDNHEGEDLIHDLLREVGEDPKRGGLLETPKRVMKAWRAWTEGYGQDPKSVLKTFEDGAEKAEEMVYEGGIPFYSHCEHHMAPFFGYVHIAYLPNGKIVGLSKLSRLVDIFAHRLSVQERLTNQVADALQEGLQPRGVAVMTQARHFCMESRGIRKTGIVTICTGLRGAFKNDAATRAEFTSLAQCTMNGIRAL